LSRIRTEYIETGKVRFVYKHFAVLGEESTRAAIASECAAEQENFWPYHDLIFTDQLAERSTLDADQLTRLAGEIGLDTGKFSECLASDRYPDQIAQESRTVQSLGVRGTPAFLVNGVYISGAQPFAVFQEVIEKELAEGK
jgi:protein-disulfide isomerase